ncbi:MAG: hypothetical protein HOW73_41480 [Polyangiaceae bacterium]|nr:hypothetical protein [Polyangiaceae bacterium]
MLLSRSFRRRASAAFCQARARGGWVVAACCIVACTFPDLTFQSEGGGGAGAGSGIGSAAGAGGTPGSVGSQGTQASGLSSSSGGSRGDGSAPPAMGGDASTGGSWASSGDGGEPTTSAGPDGGTPVGQGGEPGHGGEPGQGGEGGAPPTCVDADGDGYLSPVSAIECESLPAYLGKDPDCDDGDDSTHPDQTTFFAVPRPGGNWDYDCSGAVETEYPWTCQSPCEDWLPVSPGAQGCGDSSSMKTCNLLLGCLTPGTGSVQTQRCH